jgi:transketolase
MTHPFDAVDLLAVNTLRTLSIDAVQHANSGHPGLPLGAAPMAYVLWQRHLRFDPDDPQWPDRDRFVLSGGHGSMLLYALLHLSGHGVSLDDLKNFRQWGSPTPGHPEYGHTPGVEATTGPLGQGTANAVGMAMAEQWLSAHHNVDGHTVVDHRTYALVTDGDLMEGISNEAASLAGHLGLGKLIYLYDANDVTLDGPAAMHFSENVAARYTALGWHVQTVENGDTDLGAIDAALTRAEVQMQRPSLVVVKTTIGYGSPKKAGSSAAHGAPLGTDEVAATKAALGWTATEPFTVPAEVRTRFAEAAARGRALRRGWIDRFGAWAQDAPDRASAWEMAFSGVLPDGFDTDLPEYTDQDGLATRTAGGKALGALAARVPWLLGGDADLGSSTKTRLSETATFGDGDGRNIHFGVREHAMGAIANGMLYHGGVRPFVATFLVFSDYMRPPLRLAALSRLPLISVFTHDSIGVGEDGPTHQPVEHFAALRAIPDLLVIRPADGNETSAAWKIALEQTDRPVALVLSRQDLPVVTNFDAARNGLARGAWIVREAKDASPAVVLIATGSEVALAVQAARELEDEGITTRVVSMPCWELFVEQDAAYRRSVLAPEATVRVAIEAGVSQGWHRWVGENGLLITLDRFGASAPGERVQAELGYTTAKVVDAVRKRLAL